MPLTEWEQLAKGVIIIDGSGNPTGSESNPLTDNLSIVATSFGGATDVSGEIAWREIR